MRRRQNRESGFTLVELMIVLFLTSLLLYSIYQLFDNSTRLYKAQDDLVTMQSHVRFAIEQLRTDIKNAGFQASPNTVNDDNVCPKPGTNHKSIRLEYNDLFKDKFSNANKFIVPLSIYLFGDIRVGQSYFTEYVSGNSIKIKGTFTEDEFNRIFTTDSYLRIVNHDQYEMIYKITNSTFSSQTVEIEGTPPVVSELQPCGIDGLGENELVNVVDYVRYRIIFDPADTKGRRTLLVREYLKQDGTTVRDRGVTVIADNVVDMQFYDFVFDKDTTRKIPDLDRTLSKIEQVLDDSDNGKLGSGNSATAGGDPKPEDLRFMTVVLSVRSEFQDRNVTHEPRETSIHEPLRTFKLFPLIRGACRTMTVATKLELRSLSVRNMKPGL